MRNLMGAPLKMIGPVTRADGSKTGIGRGYGGARVELENLTTTDPHSRQLLAAQIIWTLARLRYQGPVCDQRRRRRARRPLRQGGAPPTWQPPTPARSTARRPVCTR